jgi:hypothetical protein
MVSHYSQLGEHEWRPLDEALQPPSVYVTLSRYAALLAPYLERFPRERLLILRQEELLDRRHETMRRVFRFLGVDESFWSPAMSRVRNVSAAKGGRYWRWERIRRTRFGAPLRALPASLRWRLERLAGSTSPQEEPPVVAPALRAAVTEALEPDLAELEGLTGWDLSDWRGDPSAARR